MKKLIYFLAPLLIILTSCNGGFKEVEFQGIENVKIEKADKEMVVIIMDAKVYNPNSFNIKIKPSEMNMLIGDKNLGKAKITNLTKLKKMERGSYPFKIEAKWKDLLGGSLGGLLGVISKSKIDLTLRGDLKCGAFGITKTVPVDYTKSVDLSAIKGVL